LAAQHLGLNNARSMIAISVLKSARFSSFHGCIPPACRTRHVTRVTKRDVVTVTLISILRAIEFAPGVNVSFLVPWYPSKSGLPVPVMHKHIVNIAPGFDILPWSTYSIFVCHCGHVSINGHPFYDGFSALLRPRRFFPSGAIAAHLHGPRVVLID